MQHPERIHPLLWRGAQWVRSAPRPLASGWPALDAQLGGGWPTDGLIELRPAALGLGEVRLLRATLATLPGPGQVVLLNPPLLPSAVAWAGWGLAPHTLLWVRTRDAHETLWAAHQVLRAQVSRALLCWPDAPAPDDGAAAGGAATSPSYAALLGLCRAAQRSRVPAWLYRSPTAAGAASPVRTRLALTAAPDGLHIHFLRRARPALGASTAALTLHWHDFALDRPAPAATPGHLARVARTPAGLHAAPHPA